MNQMNEHILADIRNKLTVPLTALERLVNGEKEPKEYLELVLKELNAAMVLLQEQKI